VPLAIIGLGVFTVLKGFDVHTFRVHQKGFFYRGMAIIIAGIIAFYLPMVVWIALLLGILALWMIASAFMLLSRARKGRAAIPEGFTSRIVIAILSLCLVGLIIIDPLAMVGLLMVILGFVALVLGIMLTVNGIRLRGRMKKSREIRSNIVNV